MMSGNIQHQPSGRRQFNSHNNSLRVRSILSGNTREQIAVENMELINQKKHQSFTK